MYTSQKISPATYIFGFFGVIASLHGFTTLISSSTAIDSSFMLLLGGITFLIGLTISIVCWRYLSKGLKKQKIITELVNLNSYTDVVIVDTFSSTRRNNARVWHKYICIDPKTEKKYESDFLPELIFEIGGRAKVAKDDIGYPGIYWVDLNTVTYDDKDKEYAMSYRKNKIYEQAGSSQKEPKNTKDIMAYGLPIIFMGLGGVVAITGIDMVKSSLKGMYSLVGYAFSGIGALLFLIGIGVLIDAFQKRKRNNVKGKNIVYIGIIQAVEKAGSFRTVPLGFGVSEKDITDIDSSIAEDEEIDPALYGYPYRFQVNINGITYTTQVFSEPFPKKYSSGGKIRIYFNDMSYSGEFVTDLDSIDELN